MRLKNSKYFRWGFTAFLVILASIFCYYIIFHFSNILESLSSVLEVFMPVVLGFATAYLLTPVLNYVEKKILCPLADKLHIKNNARRKSIIRGIGIFITIFLMIALVYALIAMLVSQIVPSIRNIVLNFDTYIANFVVWLDALLADNQQLGDYIMKLVNRYSAELEIWLNEKVLTASSEVIKTVSLSVINVLAVLWDFIIGVVISVYLLNSKEKFAGQAKKIVYAVCERENANRLINNFRFTHKTFIGFISGKILDSIIIGLLCFIGTTLLQTPYAVLVSVIVGVTNIIPFFGPYIGAIPSTILILVVDPMNPLNSVYFAIFILLLQQFDGNILGPKILGDSTGLTGFWVIFSITIFGGFFGVLGMIVGVPIFAIMYAAVKSIVLSSLEAKSLPLDTETYIKVGKFDDNGVHEYSTDELKNIKNLQLNTSKINSKLANGISSGNVGKDSHMYTKTERKSSEEE